MFTARGFMGVLAGLNTEHEPGADQTREVIDPSEEATYQIVVDEILRDLEKLWADTTTMRRDAHVKPHGLVKAWVEVLEHLPEELRQGVFCEPGRRYPAWVRFSNGQGKPQPDKSPDGRGMAVKLMGVEGEKLLAEPQGAMTQDFVMIDNPVFFIDNPECYVGFEQATSDNHQLSYLLNPLTKRRLERLREFAQAYLLAAADIQSPLNQRYWSMVPFKLGPHNVKFSARPLEAAALPEREAEPGPNFLRESMMAQLATREALFSFEVQTQVPGKDMPIEDPTVEWKESDSPFVPVARIRIPAQDFATAERDALSERLAFNPWHGLLAHRPVGGINRLRKSVYEAISVFRRSKNGVTLNEPTEWEM